MSNGNGHEHSQFGESMRKGVKNPWVGGTALVALVTGLNQGLPPVIEYFRESDQRKAEQFDAAHARTAEAYQIAIEGCKAEIERIALRRDTARAEFNECRNLLNVVTEQCSDLQFSASRAPEPALMVSPDVGAGPPPTIWADEPELELLDDALEDAEEWLEETEE